MNCVTPASSSPGRGDLALHDTNENSIPQATRTVKA